MTDTPKTPVEQALYEIDHPGSVPYARATHVLVGEVRRLQGESDAFKLRVCSIEIVLACLIEDEPLKIMPKERYDALVADAERLAEALESMPSTTTTKVEPWTKWFTKRAAAIAEHEKLMEANR